MSSYQTFATVYDQFMRDVPYEDWVEYIITIMNKYKAKPEIVLDMGCGTGNITRLFAKKGYDMIGIDNSIDMLSIAKDKAKKEQQDILYLQQDMREFELYGTVGCAISVCDSINYILDEEELVDVFKLVNNYLDPKGLFIFDMNTEYKYKNMLGNQTFAQNLEDSAYIWENYYYKEEKINEYELALFIKSEENTYNKFEETHYQKAYSNELIINLIEKSGLEFVAMFEALTFNQPNEESERVYFIAREKGK